MRNNNKRVASTLCGVFALTAVHNLQADDEMLLSAFMTEDDFLASVPIVLTATRISQPANVAPVSSTVIDREMIEASGFRDLVDVLRLAPGFQVAHGNGGYFVPTYHGLSDDWPRRLQVQVDGRSVYTPLLSTVNWDHLGITIEDVERIEVIRGSNNSVHGSNAFLGVVNFITRQPFQDQGGEVSVTLGSYAAGEVRQALKDKSSEEVVDAATHRDVFARYANSLDKWDYRVSLAYREDDGFANVDDSKDIRGGSLRFVGSLSPAESLDIQLGLSNGTSGGGANATDREDPFTPVRDIDQDSRYQHVLWSRALPGNDELSVRVYHNYYQASDRFSVGKLSSYFAEQLASGITFDQLFPTIQDQEAFLGYNDGETERYDAELQYVNNQSRLRAVWGVGMRQDSLQSRLALAKSDTIYDVSGRVFGHLDYAAGPRAHLSAGVMLEHNQIVGLHYSPRVAINWQATEYHNLRLSASRSVRSPSLLEANMLSATQYEDGQLLTILRRHAEDVKPETLRSVELALIEKIPSARTTIDVKIFHEELRDAIFDATDLIYTGQPKIFAGCGNQMIPDPSYANCDVPVQPFVYLNGVDADSDGMELQVSYRPRKHSFISFQYAYIETKATQHRFLDSEAFLAVSGVNKSTYRPVDEGVPTHTVSMLAAHRLPWRLDASVGYYRMTQMRWYGDGDRLPPYSRVDARLAKQFRMHATRINTALVMQNLLKDYSEFREENIFDQRIFVQAGVEF